MLYTTFTVNDKEYKLRLAAKEAVNLEKKLQANPLNLIVAVGQKNEIPELSVLLEILFASMTHFQHGVTLADVYDIYDEFCDEGNTIIDLIPIILDVFKVSGFFKADAEETEEKN